MNFLPLFSFFLLLLQPLCPFPLRVVPDDEFSFFLFSLFFFSFSFLILASPSLEPLVLGIRGIHPPYCILPKILPGPGLSPPPSFHLSISTHSVSMMVVVRRFSSIRFSVWWNVSLLAILVMLMLMKTMKNTRQQEEEEEEAQQQQQKRKKATTKQNQNFTT